MGELLVPVVARQALKGTLLPHNLVVLRNRNLPRVFDSALSALQQVWSSPPHLSWELFDPWPLTSDAVGLRLHLHGGGPGECWQPHPWFQRRALDYQGCQGSSWRAEAIHGGPSCPGEWWSSRIEGRIEKCPSDHGGARGRVEEVQEISRLLGAGCQGGSRENRKPGQGGGGGFQDKGMKQGSRKKILPVE